MSYNRDCKLDCTGNNKFVRNFQGTLFRFCHTNKGFHILSITISLTALESCCVIRLKTLPTTHTRWHVDVSCVTGSEERLRTQTWNWEVFIHVSLVLEEEPKLVLEETCFDSCTTSPRGAALPPLSLLFCAIFSVLFFFFSSTTGYRVVLTPPRVPAPHWCWWSACHLNLRGNKIGGWAREWMCAVLVYLLQAPAPHWCWWPACNHNWFTLVAWGLIQQCMWP
jgi:hypothetical protein